MRHRSIGGIVCAGVLAFALGCGGGGEEQEAGMGDAPAMPDTTAAAVWAHLQSSNYQSWTLWPGKARLYAGGDPHGMLLTTYVNGPALQAINARSGVMPAGAFIVKENYMPDSTLAAVTVMYKSPGYNAEHNDWFWVKRNADGTVAAEGRVEGCQNCHGGNRANDYILTAAIIQ